MSLLLPPFPVLPLFYYYLLLASCSLPSAASFPHTFSFSLTTHGSATATFFSKVLLTATAPATPRADADDADADGEGVGRCMCWSPCPCFDPAFWVLFGSDGEGRGKSARRNEDGVLPPARRRYRIKKDASIFWNVFSWCGPVGQLSSRHHVSYRWLNTKPAQARSPLWHLGGPSDLSQRVRWCPQMELWGGRGGAPRHVIKPCQNRAGRVLLL